MTTQATRYLGDGLSAELSAQGLTLTDSTGKSITLESMVLGRLMAMVKDFDRELLAASWSATARKIVPETLRLGALRCVKCNRSTLSDGCCDCCRICGASPCETCCNDSHALAERE
jgi:hypothetical protein